MCKPVDMGKRNLEKRREKSRCAARCRRKSEAGIFTDLHQAVPIVRERTITHVDRLALLRIAAALCRSRFVADRVFPVAVRQRTDDVADAVVVADGHVSREEHKKRKATLRSGSAAAAATVATTAAFFSEMSLADCLDGFVAIVDSTSLIVYISFGVSRVLGITQSDFVGHRLSDYLHPDDVFELQHVLQPAVDGSVDVPTFLRMKSVLSPRGRNLNLKSALYKMVCMTFMDASLCFPCSNLSGEASGGGRDGGDVFSRRLARGERETVDQQAKGFDDCAKLADCPPGVYFLVYACPLVQYSNVDNIGAGCYMTRHTIDMKITYCHENLAKYLGYDQKLLTGSSLFAMIHPEDIRSFTRSIREMYKKGQIRTGYYRLLSGNGDVVWMTTDANVIHQTSRGLRTQYVVCMHHMISGLSRSTVASSVDRFSAGSQTKLWPQDEAGAGIQSESEDFRNRTSVLDSTESAAIVKLARNVVSPSERIDVAGRCRSAQTDVGAIDYDRRRSANRAGEGKGLAATTKGARIVQRSNSEKRGASSTSFLESQNACMSDRLDRPADDQLNDLHFLMPFVKYNDVVLFSHVKKGTSSANRYSLFTDGVGKCLEAADKRLKEVISTGQPEYTLAKRDEATVDDVTVKSPKRHPWLNCPLEPVSPLQSPPPALEELSELHEMSLSPVPLSCGRCSVCDPTESVLGRLTDLNYPSLLGDLKEAPSMAYPCASGCSLDLGWLGDDQSTSSSYLTSDLTSPSDEPPQLISLEMADQLENSLCCVNPLQDTNHWLKTATATTGDAWKHCEPQLHLCDSSSVTATTLSSSFSVVEPGCYTELVTAAGPLGGGSTGGQGADWRRPFHNVSFYIRNAPTTPSFRTESIQKQKS